MRGLRPEYKENSKVKFRVIGVFEEEGESFVGGDSFDRQIIVPFNSFKKIYRVGKKGSNAALIVKGNSELDPGLENLEYELTGVLRARRGLKPTEDQNFAINRPEYLTGFVSAIWSQRISGICASWREMAGQVHGCRCCAILVGDIEVPILKYNGL